MSDNRPYLISRYENNVDFVPDDVSGIYDIPSIRPEPYAETVYIPFVDAGALQYQRERYGIHFFISDYQFVNIWTRREKYREMLPGFSAVLTPDFSLFTDWPFPVQLWNHYRKHLIGAWMQSIGCRVYPTISWSNDESYAWCFDGEPHHSTVCVSSVGTQRNRETKGLFLAGYDRMMEVLEPETILFYGRIPKECKGNIVPMEYTRKGSKEVDEGD